MGKIKLRLERLWYWLTTTIPEKFSRRIRNLLGFSERPLRMFDKVGALVTITTIAVIVIVMIAKILPALPKRSGADVLLIGVCMGVGIIGIVGIVFGAISLVYFLAKNNIFWTIVKEGTAKAILKFGKLQRIVMTYRNCELDERWKVIEKEAEPGRSKKSGLRLVGIPFVHSVYQYNFRWTSFEQAEEGGSLSQKAIAHQEILDYILVQDDIYYTFIRGAETNDMVPVDVDLLLTIRIVNPYLALFRVQNWLEATQNQLKPVLRSYIANKTFSDLITRKEGTAREMEELLMRTAEAKDATKDEKLGSYLERHYGVRIKKIGLARIDPAGDRGKVYQEAASKHWEAEKEKERITVIADADVGRMERVYGKITSYGPSGLSIKMMETIEKAAEKEGNWFIPFPLQNLINELGNKTKKKGGEQ